MDSVRFWSEPHSRSGAGPAFLQEAGPADQKAVRELFATPYLGTRQFSWADWQQPEACFRTLLAGGSRHRPWGVLVLQMEARPSTLAAHIPDRIYCRGVAVARGCTSQGAVRNLLAGSLVWLRRHRPEGQLWLTTNRTWLRKAAVRAGFTRTDGIRYLHCNLPLRAHASGMGQVQPVADADFPVLAARDADTFSPQWHMGEEELRNWSRQGILLTLKIRDTLAGYALYTQPQMPPELGSAFGFLVRLAVWPEFQGHRLGTRLLLSTAERLQARGLSSMKLNVLASDTKALGFYAHHGFRSIGRPYAVLHHGLGLQICSR